MNKFDNVTEKLSAIYHWLNFQRESLSFGLKSIADAEKLYDYWMANDKLPEYCDADSDDMTYEEVAEYRVIALGYDPMNEVNNPLENK